MADIPEDTLYDVRLIERHIRKGLITRKDVDKRAKDATDVEAQGEALSIEDPKQSGTGSSQNTD